ncbi:ABC transporter substrate-binding protein [Streptomyces sp. TP-A0874]|uniref:ABC transporter substrate-binding protein n=1 Tax=Streptomyces sp. TP-A0874 TaxID=549819 RepID=UPI00099F9243|nr:extracellular solute-binding protein [Streptomyces sp. TP-A0874]
MNLRSRARRTRAVSVLAAASLGVSLLAGCGSNGPASGDSDTLNVWVYQDASGKVQEQAVKEFNKTSKVKAKLHQIPADGYEDKLRTGMGSPNAPDVFFNWGGGSIKDYVDQGQILDLGPTLEKDPELAEAFVPSVFEGGRIGGKQYGIPMRGVQPVILFYNKAVFEAAGAEPPGSWEDLLGLVDTFKKEGVTPFALGGADAWPELMWLEYLVDRYGGAEVFQTIQDGDSGGWTDPAMLKGAETIRELVDRGAFGKNFASVNYVADGASTLFAKGRAAMHLMGSWEYANQLANQPEFAKKDLGYVAFPALPGGSGDSDSIVGNPTNYWSINARSKHQEAAVEFAKLAAEPFYAEALVANGDVPPAADSASLLKKHSTPDYAEFQYELVEKAPAFTLSWDQALPPSVVTPLNTNLQQLFNGKLSPKGFVEAMKAAK